MPLHLIGVEFSREQRTVVGFEVESVVEPASGRCGAGAGDGLELAVSPKPVLSLSKLGCGLPLWIGHQCDERQRHRPNEGEVSDDAALIGSTPAIRHTFQTQEIL